MINYTKLDPALVEAIEDQVVDAGHRYKVFIRTTHVPRGKEVSLLESLGIRMPRLNQLRVVFTANLPAESIRTLTDQPWVETVELSRQLHS